MNTNATLKNTREFIRIKSVWERIKKSSLFKDYQKTFEASTGLPLELQFAFEDQVSLCNGSCNQNRFCKLLNANNSCEKCLMAQKCLNQRGSGVQSMSCFAGLKETVVPIMIGDFLIARLRTGQILHESPSSKTFMEVAQELGETDGVNQGNLEKAYLATPVIEKQRYRAMVTLLATFSMQLRTLAKQLYYDEKRKEHNVMELAKDYIEENFMEEIILQDIAEEVFMSPHHFCRKFKETTGMTMTDFITKRRIEEARALLHERKMKITDIAFEVGFQSLSQFNRSFSKLNGMSPSGFRKEMLAA